MIEENNNFNIVPEVQKNQAPQPEITADYVNPYSFTPESYHTKIGIRHLATIVGIPCILISVIGYIWSFVYLFFTMKIAGMSYTDAVELSQNPAMQQMMQIIISCIIFLVPFTVAAKCAGVRIDNTIRFGKAKHGTALPFILFGIGFCSFANVATSYASKIFEGFGINYEVDFGEEPKGFFGFLITFIATASVPALVEEFACRGIVLGILKKYGEGFAIITSSIVFGVMHGNFEQIPFAIIVGLILGYIYVKTNSIWICTAVHCVNNAVSVIFTYLQNVVTVNMQNLLYIIYLIISMLTAIFGIYLFAKNTQENYELENKTDTVTQNKKYTWFFTSWAIIVFLCLNIYNALTYFESFKKIIYNIIGSIR